MITQAATSYRLEYTIISHRQHYADRQRDFRRRAACRRLLFSLRSEGAGALLPRRSRMMGNGTQGPAEVNKIWSATAPRLASTRLEGLAATTEAARRLLRA